MPHLGDLGDNFPGGEVSWGPAKRVGRAKPIIRAIHPIRALSGAMGPCRVIPGPRVRADPGRRNGENDPATGARRRNENVALIPSCWAG